MTSSRLKTINTVIDQSVGPFFHSMGLETPQLKPLAESKGASKPANDEPVNLPVVKRQDIPVSNPVPKPEPKADEPKAKTKADVPKTKSKASTPALHAKPSAKPHRTANAAPAPQRSHGFTPANKHPTNALSHIVKPKSTAIAPKNYSQNRTFSPHELPNAKPAIRNTTAKPHGTPKWLENSIKPEKFTNPQVKEHVYAVRDYLAAARNGNSGDGSEEAMKRATQHMNQLEAMSHDPKSHNPKSFDFINAADRKQIGDTKKLYEGYRKLGYGQHQEDPDISLLKMSFGNRNRAADNSPDENRFFAQGPHIPKKIDVDKFPKQPWKTVPNYKGPIPSEVAQAKPKGHKPAQAHPHAPAHPHHKNNAA